MIGVFFLHGLDSSGRGTKGRFFEKNYPDVKRPDFTGTLQERLESLGELCSNYEKLIFVGSSFGGLMATCYAVANPQLIHRLVLLAPALNFDEFEPPRERVAVETLTVIGDKDDVTPANLVIPKIEKTFSDPEIRLVEDDHFLHQIFAELDWQTLLAFS